jgi:hypothetical protein
MSKPTYNVERPYGDQRKGQSVTVKRDGKSGKRKGDGFWDVLG